MEVMRTEFSPAHEVEHQLRALLFPDEGEGDVEGHDIGFFKKVEVRVWNRSRIGGLTLNTLNFRIRPNPL